jgi:hypothetical protein
MMLRRWGGGQGGGSKDSSRRRNSINMGENKPVAVRTGRLQTYGGRVVCL